MSIVYDNDFINKTEFPFNKFRFDSLFNDCLGLTSAENLILPATVLTPYCYYSMFGGCKALTTPPQLPATTLASGCYTSMFSLCDNLTTAPELPATTLVQNCYNYMFHWCTSLTTAPELPVTTLTTECYAGMFSNCTKLTTAPELPATTLADYCYSHMFEHCSNLHYIKCLATDISADFCTDGWVTGISSDGKFEANENMHSWSRGNSGIPEGWITQDDITNYNTTDTFTPGGYITFNILEDNTVFGIGQKSTNQTIYISKNGSTWMNLAEHTCINVNNGDIIYACGNLTGNNGFHDKTTFYITGMTTLSGNCNYIWDKDTGSNTLKIYCGNSLFKNCKKLNINNFSLPSTNLKTYCYESMFYGCTSLTTAPELPAIILTEGCYENMFYGCTSLTTAPELPATSLVQSCYWGLFSGCSSLNYIKCLAKYYRSNNNPFQEYATDDWVNGVAVSGTFIKSSSVSDYTTGKDGIPSGWTVQDAA